MSIVSKFIKEKEKRDIDFGRVLTAPVSNTCQTWALGKKCCVRAT